MKRLLGAALEDLRFVDNIAEHESADFKVQL